MNAEEVLTRGVENVYPSRDVVLEKLKSVKPLTFYLGIDPTGPLHIGHSIVLRKLGHIQRLGHKVILLIGGFTAQIGDPTGKSKTRKPLSISEVKENAKNYKKLASIFLNFTGKNAAKVDDNSRWLSKMNLSQISELASHVTVDQMIKRDMFEERMKTGLPIFIHEFLYPLLHGYDSVAMKVDGEVGANDQTFNMLMGRQLEKQILNKEKIVIATKLLTDASGRKMGKTEGNMVSLDESPNEMFRKITGWTNEMIIPAFELLTEVPMSEIQKMEKDLKNGAEAKKLLIKLAREVIKIYHGGKAAALANAVEGMKTALNQKLSDVLVEMKILKSKSDFVRLLNAGSISDINGKKISDKNFVVTEPITLKVGKRTIRIET